jgi:SET domain-containing protein
MITGNSWFNPKLEVKESALHCNGVFAREHIRKNERLAIFGGSVMLIDDIYTLPENVQNYAMQIEERFVFGNRSGVPDDTDYFNHSCEPNSGFSGQIFLVAMRDVSIGEEITFDYAMIVSESVGSNLVFEMECRCGMPNCRKKFTENDLKIPELRMKYKEYFSEYLKKKILIEL